MAQSLRRLLLAAVMALVLVLFTTRSVHADFTEARYTATSLFLGAFPYSFPSLQSTWRGAEFCSWPGVTCDNSTAITYVSVSLPGQGLTGTLPTISNFVTNYNLPVVRVDLSNNHGITGTFNVDWAALRYLQALDLSNTNMNGAIPDSWNSMINLVTVNVSHTYACKGLPNWNITSLRVADLSNNRLKGVLASSWGSMKELTYLDISNNGFCGCVPDTWTTTLLTNAATAIGGNLVSSSCDTSNRCTSDSYKCASAAASPASVVLIGGFLLSLLVAIAAL